MTLINLTYDRAERAKKWASLDDHHWQATSSSIRPTTRLLIDWPSREPVWKAQWLIEQDGRAKHVHCNTTAGRPHSARSQLKGIESYWQRCVAAVKAALQVSGTWPRPGKSWPDNTERLTTNQAVTCVQSLTTLIEYWGKALQVQTSEHFFYV